MNSRLQKAAPSFRDFRKEAARDATLAYGINDSGQIVGTYLKNGAEHGFLDSGGTFTAIDFPGASNTEVFGINNNGLIVGIFTVGPFFGGSFLYSGGSFTPINAPATPNGINDSSQIVGTIVKPQGYLYSWGQPYLHQCPRCFPNTTTAYGINDNGQIVGYYDDSAGRHGYLDSGGSFTAFDVVPPTEIGGTLAFGINNSGQVVGRFNDVTGTHGFLATPPVPPVSYIPFSPGSGNLATGINGNGEIVGFYGDIGPPGHFNGFVRDPNGAITTFNPPGTAGLAARGSSQRSSDGAWPTSHPIYV